VRREETEFVWQGWSRERRSLEVVRYSQWFKEGPLNGWNSSRRTYLLQDGRTLGHEEGRWTILTQESDTGPDQRYAFQLLQGP